MYVIFWNSWEVVDIRTTTIESHRFLLIRITITSPGTINLDSVYRISWAINSTTEQTTLQFWPPVVEIPIKPSITITQIPSSITIDQFLENNPTLFLFLVVATDLKRWILPSVLPNDYVATTNSGISNWDVLDMLGWILIFLRNCRNFDVSSVYKCPKRWSRVELTKLNTVIFDRNYQLSNFLETWIWIKKKTTLNQSSCAMCKRCLIIIVITLAQKRVSSFMRLHRPYCIYLLWFTETTLGYWFAMRRAKPNSCGVMPKVLSGKLNGAKSFIQRPYGWISDFWMSSTSIFASWAKLIK